MSPLTRSREYVDWTKAISCVDVDDRLRRRVCRRCATALGGRQRAYCGKDCEREFGMNHFWNMASREVEKRNRTKYGDLQCCVCGATAHLEINHIDPVRGGPRFATCKNHQDNLEVLCHDCHVRATELQFRPAKAEARQAQKVLSL